MPSIEPADLPPGWTAIQQMPHSWALVHRGEFVAELALSLVGDWRWCLPGEFLPRPTTYPTPAAAITALLGITPRPAARPSPRPRERAESRPERVAPRAVLSSYAWQLDPRRSPKS